MKRITFILISLFTCLLMQAQTITNDPLKIPDYIPKSPEAAGFAKYGDIPVSEYTGTANISIPIHVVKSGELSLPIELSYHPSGIQVAQEATWVGLGWNLIAGGAITYTPAGGNDQINTLSLLWDDRSKLLNYIGVGEPGAGTVGYEDDYMGWTCGYFSLNPTSQVSWAAVYAGLMGQGQPDIYNVNFLNYSFKFFMHPRTNTPVLIGKMNKCQVEKSGNIFIITGEDGVKYFFGNNGIEWDNQLGNTCMNAWYLTQILSPDGHSITLNYSSSGSINAIASLSERGAFNYPKNNYQSEGFKRQLNSTGNQTSNLHLTSIETSNEKVSFITDSSRIDLLGNAKRLRAIKVVDKISNSEIMRDSLSYDYFTGSNVGGDYTHDDSFNTIYIVADNVLRKRLKLTKLTRYDTNAAKGEEYSFTYNDSIPLPLKTSFATDYWGYYNGQENNSTVMLNNAQHTSIPDIFSLTLQSHIYDSIPDVLKQYKGANRGTSVTNITACMLKSITYPTGGKTVFQFEPHTFTNQTYVSAEDKNSMFTHESPNVYFNNNVASKPSQTFTVNSRTFVHFTGTINGNVNSQPYTLDQLLGAGITIASTTGPQTISYGLTTTTDFTGNIKSWDEYFFLDAGNYILTCGVPATLGYQGYSDIVSATLNYDNYNASVLTNAIPTGGGVRVKTISNYDANNNLVLTKNYIYKGGLMLIPLRYLNKRMLTGATAGLAHSWENKMTYTLSSDSYNPPASAFAGTNVGYNQVEITTLSGSNTNGKEIINFQNTPALNIVADYPVYEFCYTNGDVLKRIDLNASNDTVQVENNTYSQSDQYREFINYMVDDTYIGPTGDCSSDGLGNPPINLQAYIGRFRIIAFPNTGLWSYLQSKQTTDYFNGSKLIKTINYSYNPINYQIKEIDETKSDGHQKRTVLKYPHDYPTTSPCDSLIQLHIINPVIVDSTFIDSKFLERVKTNYSSQHGGVYQPYGGVIEPFSVESQIGNNASKIRLQYAQRDSYYNPVYLIQNEATNIVYLWSYNYLYPVAKIEGLTYSDVVSALTQNFIDNLSATLIPTANQLNTIRTALAAKTALVTTYTYKPLIGITTATDPRGVTTNYTYDTFNRLYLVRNDDQNIIGRNRYGYQNAPDNGQGGYSSLVGATVNPGAASYPQGSTGTATVTGVSGGSGSYSYSWYLKNSSGSVLASTLNTTATSFSYTCSQTGILTVQCVVTDTQTGITSTTSTNISSNSILAPSITPGAGSYNYAATGTATRGNASGGSGNYSYSWYLKNSSGTVLASVLNTSATSFSYTCFQVGTLTIQCVATDNVTGSTATASTNITCNAVVVSGNFTLLSGYTNAYNTISSNGTVVSFVLSFLPNSSPMTVGTSYYVATVCQGCQPSVVRTITYVTGGRTWNITFNPDKSVYCQIVSGTNLPTGNGVGLGTLTYNLW